MMLKQRKWRKRRLCNV